MNASASKRLHFRKPLYKVTLFSRWVKVGIGATWGCGAAPHICGHKVREWKSQAGASASPSSSPGVLRANRQDGPLPAWCPATSHALQWFLPPFDG